MRNLQSLKDELLQKVVEGEPALDLLHVVCRELEQKLPGTIVGVTMLDRTAQVFEHAVFPSLSKGYAEALKGIQVADKPGSCALAVFTGKTVICDDVLSDPRFADGWKKLGLEHGLRSLISIPTIGPRGIALGTLVVAFQPEKPLNRTQRRLADSMAAICGLLLRYRRNQQRHQLLLGELQHRVRNLFNMIGAVVYATLRSHPGPEEFRKSFDGRLKALAKAHSLAVNPGEAELRQLIKDTLAPYSIDHEIRVTGPRLMLTQEAAVALSLAAHELATNAAKYGALSADGGSVNVQWDLTEGTAEPRFVFDWIERGGPRVNPPNRQGYGQKTVTRSVASAFDGAVELNYDPEGFHCRITAPLSGHLGGRGN